jgi:hypothetical protein
MSPSEIPREQIERRDFSLVGVNYRRPRPVSERHPAGWEHESHKFVVGSPSVPVARRVGRAYAAMRWGEPHQVHVYPRNYIQDARQLVAAGECVQGPEEI